MTLSSQEPNEEVEGSIDLVQPRTFRECIGDAFVMLIREWKAILNRLVVEVGPWFLGLILATFCISYVLRLVMPQSWGASHVDFEDSALLWITELIEVSLGAMTRAVTILAVWKVLFQNHQEVRVGRVTRSHRSILQILVATELFIYLVGDLIIPILTSELTVHDDSLAGLQYLAETSFLFSMLIDLIRTAIYVPVLFVSTTILFRFHTIRVAVKLLRDQFRVRTRTYVQWYVGLVVTWTLLDIMAHRLMNAVAYPFMVIVPYNEVGVLQHAVYDAVLRMFILIGFPSMVLLAAVTALLYGSCLASSRIVRDSV